MFTRSWSVADVPDLTGKTVMVTGGTSGIGLEVARVVAERGAHVVLPAITAEEGRTAAETIGGSTEVHPLDLTDLRAVAGFARGFTDPVDILFDNAGLMSKTRKTTRDGVELHLAVNFLGPFLLTQLLLPRIRERVVITASMAHAEGRVDLADPNFEHRRFSMAAAYAQSKLACMLWALELQRRLDADGSDVQVQIAHPGFALTSILDVTPFPAVNKLIRPLGSLVVPSAADGARPLLYAAVEELEPVSYVGPTGFKQISGAPGPGRRAPPPQDREAAAALWEWADRTCRDALAD